MQVISSPRLRRKIPANEGGQKPPYTPQLGDHLKIGDTRPRYEVPSGAVEDNASSASGSIGPLVIAVDEEARASERGSLFFRPDRDCDRSEPRMLKRTSQTPKATWNWSFGRKTFALGLILVANRTRITLANKATIAAIILKHENSGRNSIDEFELTRRDIHNSPFRDQQSRPSCNRLRSPSQTRTHSRPVKYAHSQNQQRIGDTSPPMDIST